LSSFRVVVWDGKEAINISVGKAVDAVWFWADAITIRLFRRDGVGWERAGSGGKWEWGLEVAKMAATLALVGPRATVESPSRCRRFSVVVVVVNYSVR
jgi:hypothetical protein